MPHKDSDLGFAADLKFGVFHQDEPQLGKLCQSITSGLGYVPFAKGGRMDGEQVHPPHLPPPNLSAPLGTSLAVTKVSQELLVDGPVAHRGTAAAAQGCRS